MFQNGEFLKTTLEMMISVECINSKRFGLVKGRVLCLHIFHHTSPWPSIVPLSPVHSLCKTPCIYQLSVRPTIIYRFKAVTIWNRNVMQMHRRVFFFSFPFFLLFPLSVHNLSVHTVHNSNTPTFVNRKQYKL